MLAEIPLTQTELDAEQFSFLTDEDNMLTYHSQLARGAKTPKPVSKTYQSECKAFMPVLLRTNISRAQAVKTIGRMSAEERKSFRADNTTSYPMPTVLGGEDVKFQATTVKSFCSFSHLYVLQHL